MPKIVFIGAGSIVFTKKIMMDIFLEKVLYGSTIVLMDINKERLQLLKKYSGALLKSHKLKIKVETTTDRRKALQKADYVITSFQVGGLEATKSDFEIPAKYGFKAIVADTTGPGGMFRGLRSIPVLLSICKDMEELCPEALLLNYVNPMPILSTAMQRESTIRSIGLCHAVKGTMKELYHLLGYENAVPPANRCYYEFAGINHLAWLTKFIVDGKDMYPRLRNLRKTVSLENKIWVEENNVNYDLLDKFGLFVSEQADHQVEYNPYYIKKDTEIKNSANKGMYPFAYLDTCMKYLNEYEKNIEDSLKEPGLPLTRSHEDAVDVIKAHFTNVPERVHGSVLNKGYIKNLPDHFSVEVPVFVDRGGFHPCTVEALPPAPAAYTNTVLTTSSLIVDGYLKRDKKILEQAFLLDPILSAILTLDEIESLFEEMFEAN